MAQVFEGQLSAAGARFGIVAGRFNGFIVEQLVAGARDAIRRTGGDDESTRLYWAPGAFEIPQVLARVVAAGGVDGIVCVGAVIRGSTPHFDYVAGAAARGVASIAERTSIPVGFGVLTCDTIEQAIERAGTKAGNKGFEAAMATVEMVDLFKRVGAPS